LEQEINSVPKAIKEYQQKQNIKSVANGIALAGIAGLAVMTGWSKVYLKIFALFGISESAAVSAAREPMVNELIGVVVSFFMSFIPFLILFLVTEKKRIDILSLKAPEMSKKALVSAVIIGVGFCNFASLLSYILQVEFSLFGLPLPSSDVELPTGVFGMIMSFLSTAFLPAFLEEFAMRGVVLGKLRKFGDEFAVFASAFLFGILHAHLKQIFFAFLVGLALGYIAVRAKSIWPAVVIHFLNNGVSVVMTYLYNIFDEKTVNLIYSAFVSVAFVVAVVLLVVFGNALFKKKEKTEETEEKERLLPTAKKIWAYILSPAMIVMVIFALSISIFMR